MDRDELTGSLLGQYQVLEPLGEGGMARVYKAIQPRLKRYVALKIILPEAAARPGFRERFEREAQLIARLQHNNIVTVYDFGEAHNLSYLVMQYVGGGNLGSKIKRNEPMAYAQAVNYTVQMARALHHAHSQGIIHRDIKPSNMLIDEKDAEHLLLSDFGIAKLLSSSADSDHGQGGLPQPITATGNIVGTPEFMAPEQAQGMAIDARTDIYSLGMVLYVLLTGSFPFRATNAWGILYQQVNNDPPPIPTLNPTVPAALVEVVSHAVAKRPEERFQSAEAFARALEASLLSSSQIDAAPTLLAEPGPTIVAPPGPTSVPGDGAGAPTYVPPGPPQPLPPAPSYTTHPQAASITDSPTRLSGQQPGWAPVGEAPQPASLANFHSSPTPLPGQAQAAPVPAPSRPDRRGVAPWLIAGVSVLLVAALVLIAVRGNLLSGLQQQVTGSSTPSPQRTSSGTITDNFTVNTNRWPTGTFNSDPGLTATLGQGAYTISISQDPAHNRTYFLIPQKLATVPAKFTLEIKVQELAGANMLGFGVIVQEATTSNTVNGYAFTINASSGYQFVKYPSSDTTAAFTTSADILPGLHQVNDLKVVANGADYTFYVNGKVVPLGANGAANVTDGTYAHGNVCLPVTGDGAALTQFAFSDFSLTTP